jgi:hypothetical protein
VSVVLGERCLEGPDLPVVRHHRGLRHPAPDRCAMVPLDDTLRILPSWGASPRPSGERAE